MLIRICEGPSSQVPGLTKNMSGRKQELVAFRRRQMSFEIPGRTDQIHEGSSNTHGSSGVFCLMVTRLFAGQSSAAGWCLLVIPCAPDTHGLPKHLHRNCAKKSLCPSKTSNGHEDTELHWHVSACCGHPPHIPSPATATQWRLSLVSEDYLLSICSFPPPSLPLLILVKCNHSTHMWAPAVESTGKCGHLIGNAQPSVPLSASQQPSNSAAVQRMFSIWERESQTG